MSVRSEKDDVKSSRAERISDYLKHNKSAKLPIVADVLLKGKYERQEVYRIPISYLVFNLDNTRFAAEKLQAEKTAGPIDETTEEGKHRLKDLLLELNGKMTGDAKNLIDDIRAHGQREAGVVTFDGSVINGNRRLACLIWLFENEHKEEYKYFNTVRLPEGLTDEELFKIEADLQWKKEFKVAYTALDQYIMLKKALSYGWTVEDICNFTLLSEKELKAAIAELTLIQEYLDTTEEQDNFLQLTGQTELFTDAVKQIKIYKERSNAAKARTAYQKLLFKFVNINKDERNTVKFDDIRRINKLYGNANDIIPVYNKIKDASVQEVKDFLNDTLFEVAKYEVAHKPEKIINQLFSEVTDLKRVLDPIELKKLSDELVEKLQKAYTTLGDILEPENLGKS